MVTYFLGQEEVSSYLRDFLERLKKVHPLPTVWCSLTRSGHELLKRMLDLIPEDDDLTEHVSAVIKISMAKKGIVFRSKSAAEDIRGKHVLLFDSSIHSGTTINQAFQKLVEFGASTISTYALVVKRQSSFIPTIWGLMIDATDRAYFLLDTIPNHRLHTSSATNISPLHIQRLSNADLQAPKVKTEVRSLNRISWGDRFFDMSTSEQHRCSYLLKQGDKIVGYLTVHRSKDNSFVVDEIAVDKKHRGKKWGGVLMRFADTLARQADCPSIRLYAIEEKIEFYEKQSYRKVSSEAISVDGERYFLMERALLYHFQSHTAFDRPPGLTGLRKH
jgi:ribosomal protein S18 acetylase RimI-like enzyme